MMRYTVICVLIVLVVACVPPGDTKIDIPARVDWSGESADAILQAQDKRAVSNLLPYLSSEEAADRLLAVQAAASFHSADLHEELLRLLKEDDSDQIKQTAAYALGQQKDSTLALSLISAFQAQDTSNYDTPIRGSILEAIGKSGDQATLDLIAGASTYTDDMTHLLLGQARAIYRYGLRGIRTQVATTKMLDLLTNNNIDEQVRRIAAQYVHRFPDVDMSSRGNALMTAFDASSDVDIKMCIAGALARSADPSVLPMLSSVLRSQEDYRIKVNILRRLGSYPYASIKELTYELIDSDDDHIWPLAVNILKSNLDRREVGPIIEKARSSRGSAKGASLYGAVLNSYPSRFINSRANINTELKVSLDSASSIYTQVDHLNALAEDPSNLPTIIDKGLASTIPYVRTAALLSLRRLMTNPRSKQIYARPSAFNALRNTISQQLLSLLEGGDAGDIAVVCGLIMDEELGMKEVPSINTSVRAAMRSLTLPQETESYKACQQAIAYLEDGTYQDEPPAYNHTINKELVSRASDSSVVYIVTNKGAIEAQLYPNEAPGSVANFIDLVEQGFYSDKSWHRVVPNFVIQTGCPRGDGYGSLDYTIRSELSHLYYDGEGYLGMASAGPDTEGTQWFITHSSTPHLDGRYTIFGKVTSGMEVVHDILQGDTIQEVRIRY